MDNEVGLEPEPVARVCQEEPDVQWVPDNHPEDVAEEEEPVGPVTEQVASVEKAVQEVDTVPVPVLPLREGA